MLTSQEQHLLIQKIHSFHQDTRKCQRMFEQGKISMKLYAWCIKSNDDMIQELLKITQMGV